MSLTKMNNVTDILMKNFVNCNFNHRLSSIIVTYNHLINLFKEFSRKILEFVLNALQRIKTVYFCVQIAWMHPNSRRFWLMGPHLILSFVVARTIQKALIFIPLFSQCVFLLLFIYYKECILRFISLVFPTRRCNSWSKFHQMKE